MAICDLLEFHGDAAEEVARKGAALSREAGDLKWAERYDEMARALAEGNAAYEANPPLVSKLTPEEEAALDREMAIIAAPCRSRPGRIPRPDGQPAAAAGHLWRSRRAIAMSGIAQTTAD